MRLESTLVRWLTRVRRSLGGTPAQRRHNQAVRRLRAYETAVDPWLAEERVLLSAPAVVLSVTDATYTENAPPVTLDPAVMASDPDADFIAGAQVKIVDYEMGQDQLSFTPQFGISGSFDNMTGILTLNGLASAGNYATVLSSVQYQNLSEAPFDLTRTIEFTITDTEPATSAAATLTLNLITVLDTPPDITLSVNEDTPTPPIVLSSNPANDPSVTHFQITNITNGTLIRQSDSSAIQNGDFITAGEGIIFQGNTNYFGPASFQFQAATGNAVGDLGGGVATASITVVSVNDAPTITVPPALNTNEGTILPINGITINDVDVAGNLMTVKFQATGPTANYTLGTTTGITFLNGTTNGGNLPLEIQGTLADLQAALATLQVQPLDNGTLNLTLVVTDELNASAQDTIPITVNNVAPVLALNPVAAINENGLATLSGTITDPGSADTFTLVVDWGDGTAPVTYTYAAGTTNFSVTHQYVDDNPTGTSFDTYTITATLTDDDTGSDMQTTTVVVNNVNPTLTLTGPLPNTIQEGEFVTVTGSATDPANQPLSMPTTINDPLTYSWSATKDGNFYTSGVGNVATFQVVDNGVYIVTMTVMDDDLGSDTKSFTINVANVAPTPTVTGATTGFEGTGISLTASSTDPANMPTTPTDNDMVFYSWQVLRDGAVYSTGSGTNFTLTPNNEGTYQVFLTASDEDGGSRTTLHTITVANVAPTAAINATDINGQFYTYVDIAVDDPGNDGISILIVWGDINPNDFLNDPFLVGETAVTRNFPTVSHRYLTAPNPQDPLAPVTITFFISDGTDIVVQQVTVAVTEQGIPAGGVYITPEPDVIVLPSEPQLVLPPQIITQPPQQIVRNEEIVSREDQRTEEETRLVLHVVGPTGVEGPAVTLPDGLLQNLRGLFAKLPDGHYRVYLVQGESRRLVIEAFVRQGRAIDPAEADQGTQERPPQVQPAMQQEPGHQDPDRVMQAERVANLLCKLEPAPLLNQASPSFDATSEITPGAGQVGDPAAAEIEQRFSPAAEPQTPENADQTNALSLAAATVVAGTSWRRAARRQRAAAGTTVPAAGEKIEKTWSRVARRARQWKPR